MVGGGTKRDDGLPAISSTNIFSALESRRRKSGKKRADKDRSDSAGGKVDDSFLPDSQQAPQVWKPTPVTVSSWADCEDDDDFFATPSLPPPMWSSNQASETVDAAQEDLSQGEESEEDEEIEEEPEEENEEEPETEATESAAGDGKSAPMVPAVAREPDRQLSRKEMRRKGLAELEAVLAELGLDQKEENDPMESTDDKKEGDANGEANGEMENIASGSMVTESKSSKRRKAKKEKSFKEGRDGEVSLDTDGMPKDDVVADDAEDNSGPADPKEVLKRLASMKKKKSSKENDGAAKAAAAEAAARATKLAAAKKKEKNHYNQQPVR